MVGIAVTITLITIVVTPKLTYDKLAIEILGCTCTSGYYYPNYYIVATPKWSYDNLSNMDQIILNCQEPSMLLPVFSLYTNSKQYVYRRLRVT